MAPRRFLERVQYLQESSAMKFDLAVVNGTVVFPESGSSDVDIAIKDGRIAAILERGTASALAAQTIDASGKLVFPGLIDAHIHFGFAEPITEYKIGRASCRERV